MTNFLTRLAARSFAGETSIRPRLASMFETARGHGTGPVAPSSLEREEIAEVDDDASARGRGQRRQPVPQSAMTDPQIPETHPDVPRESQAPRPARILRTDEQPAEVSLLSSAPPETQPSGGEHPRRALQAAPLAEQFVQETSSRAAEAAPSVRKQPEPAGAPRMPPSQFEHSAMEHSRPQSPRSTNASLRPPDLPFRSALNDDAEGQPALVSTLMNISELAAWMREAAAAMNAAGAKSTQEKDRNQDRAGTLEAEPVVQVTIGRVDVRATAETPRENKSRSASSVMSLEEYLQRRAQRGGQ